MGLSWWDGCGWKNRAEVGWMETYCKRWAEFCTFFFAVFRESFGTVSETVNTTTYNHMYILMNETAILPHQTRLQATSKTDQNISELHVPRHTKKPSQEWPDPMLLVEKQRPTNCNSLKQFFLFYFSHKLSITVNVALHCIADVCIQYNRRVFQCVISFLYIQRCGYNLDKIIFKFQQYCPTG